MTWLRFSLVAMPTVSRSFRHAGSINAVSGIARTKLPPSATKARTLPATMASHASIEVCPVQRGPGMAARRGRERLEAGRVLRDEVVVEHVLFVGRGHRLREGHSCSVRRIAGLAVVSGDTALARCLERVVGLDQRLADAEE